MMVKKTKTPLVAAANNNDVNVDDLKIWLNSLAGTEPDGISLILLMRTLKADFGFDLNVIAKTNGFSSVYEMLQNEELSTHIYVSGGPQNTAVHAVTNDSTEKIAGIISKTKKSKRSTKKRPAQRRWRNVQFPNVKTKPLALNSSRTFHDGVYSFGAPKQTNVSSLKRNVGSKQGYQASSSSKQNFHTVPKPLLSSLKTVNDLSSKPPINLFSTFDSSKKLSCAPSLKSLLTCPVKRAPNLINSNLNNVSLADTWVTGFCPMPPTKANLLNHDQPSTFIASMSGFSQSFQRTNGNTSTKPAAPRRRFTMPKLAEADDSHKNNTSRSLSSNSDSTSSGGSRIVHVKEFNKDKITVQPVNNRDSFNGLMNFNTCKINVFDCDNTTKPHAPPPTPSSPKPTIRRRFTTVIDQPVNNSSKKLSEEVKPKHSTNTPGLAKGSFYNYSPSPMLWTKALADVTTQARDAAFKKITTHPTTSPFLDNTLSQLSNNDKPAAPTLQKLCNEFANVSMAPPTVPAIENIPEDALNADLPPGSGFSDDEFEDEILDIHTPQLTVDPLVPDRNILMGIIAEYGGEVYSDVFLYEFYEMFGREMTTRDFRNLCKVKVPSVMIGFLHSFITVSCYNRIVLTHPSPYCTCIRKRDNWNMLYEILAQKPGEYVFIPENVAQSFGFQDFRAIFFTGRDHPVWSKVLSFLPNGVMLKPSKYVVPSNVMIRELN